MLSNGKKKRVMKKAFLMSCTNNWFWYSYTYICSSSYLWWGYAAFLPYRVPAIDVQALISVCPAVCSFRFDDRRRLAWEIKIFFIVTVWIRCRGRQVQPTRWPSRSIISIILSPWSHFDGSINLRYIDTYSISKMAHSDDQSYSLFTLRND